MKRPLNEMEAFRAQELLLQRATEGLSDAEAAELAALGADDDVSFDLAMAAIDLATVQPAAMPAGLADKLLVAAGVPSVTTTPEARPAEAGAAVIPITRARSRASVYVAWAAAAAGLALAIGAFLWARGQGRDPVAEVTPSLADQRAALLAAPDVKTLSWTATADPAAKGARGDVVWSPSKQEGYMRFVGLAPNDPKVTQYQLWIFDKTRDDKYPVDGGVFDVNAAGEVIVKIDPKLFVAEPVLFAVTVEPPGGVVVSKRERIVVTAAPGSG